MEARIIGVCFGSITGALSRTPEVVKDAFVRSDLKGALVVVNFPGLSSAYSGPFQADAKLFQQIIERANRAVANAASLDDKTVHWQHICLSSFSAGYGAVREILKVPAHFELIDSTFAADSIYAGLRQEQPERQINEQQMRDFLKFASMAVDGKKVFVVSHSAQVTPYASTTETADYLLRSLGIVRYPKTTTWRRTLCQQSQATRGQFSVLGFGGESGQDHLQHLHNIDLLWTFNAQAEKHD